MTLLDGKVVADSVYSELKELISNRDNTLSLPCLAAILVGNHPASESYIANKIKACERVGVFSKIIRFPEEISESIILDEIEKINKDKTIHGLIVQLPLPKHISEVKILEAISPNKDVDGFTPYNIGRMTLGLSSYLPATPAGIIEILRYYEIKTQGKNAVVLGRSNIVGTPISILLSRNTEYGNCTVTICHSKSSKIKEIVSNCDILIAAVGQVQMVKSDWIKEGAVVIDVGIHRIESASKKSGYKLVGDVDFEQVAPLCSYITPVPGGVGQMTVAMLLKNTWQAFLNNV